VASKYGCSVNDLVKWNKLSSQNVLAGQKLRVSPPEEAATASKNTGSKSSSSTTKKNKPGSTKPVAHKYVIYTVKAGDNLWEIAEKYDGVTVADIKKLNNIRNTQRLQAGQKLKIMLAD